jgi:hypothetical protein
VAAQLDASWLVTNQILFLLCTAAGWFGPLAQSLQLFGPEYFGPLFISRNDKKALGIALLCRRPASFVGEY